MTNAHDDIIEDVLARVAHRIALPDKLRAEIARDARRAWSGLRPYIAAPDDARQARNVEIVAAAHRGVPVPDLARRWRLSTRRVWQILQGAT